MDGKSIFLSDWLRMGILSIHELLNETCNVLTCQEFRDKYSCESIFFLQYYQAVIAIPKRLWSLAKCSDTINRSFFTQNDNIFSDQTGPKRWSEKLSLNKDVWTRIFKLLKNICKETKLKEFQFTLIHRTLVSKKKIIQIWYEDGR